MDKDFEIKIGDDLKLYQCFNGRKYILHPGERYFRHHKHAMHWHVWEFYNGKRKKGFHIHHLDGDPWNNEPQNLELQKASNHLSDHIKQRHKDNPEWSKEFHAKGIEAAKEWHSSPEGLAWHSEHAKRHNFGHKEFGLEVCPICRGRFTKRTSTHKFCHPNCKAKALRRRRKQDGTSV